MSNQWTFTCRACGAEIMTLAIKGDIEDIYSGTNEVIYIFEANKEVLFRDCSGCRRLEEYDKSQIELSEAIAKVDEVGKDVGELLKSVKSNTFLRTVEFIQALPSNLEKIVEDTK